MQLHGAGAYPEVQKALALMEGWNPSWSAPAPGPNSQYYFYYATQAKFNAGGAPWAKWNETMTKEYVAAQRVVPAERSGYADADGNPQEVGWWENGDTSTDRPVLDTCLAALQLMVYYRYSPATQGETP